MHRRLGSSRSDHRASRLAATVVLGAALLIIAAGCDRSSRMEGMRDPMEDGQDSMGDGQDPMEEGRDLMESTQEGGFVPQFTQEGELILPAGEIWREWPYVGTPLTPNALNDGEAPFPEFHSVYIDPLSWEHWRETGAFREGTVLAKELVTVYDENALPDGSTRQVSGRGYFMGEFAGFEIAYKSATHFPDEPGNWAYFSFGHHAPPYDAVTEERPVQECNACHMASAAEDFVFTQFYPVLRASKAR